MRSSCLRTSRTRCPDDSGAAVVAGRPTHEGQWRVWLSLGVAVVLISAASLSLGAGDLRDPALRGTLLTLRASRLLAAGLAGASLAAAGAVVQGLFQNPLASPSILGTTAGASLGGQGALLLLGAAPGATLLFASPDLFLPFGSLIGAILSLGLLLVVVRNREDLLSLLLTGFLLSALFLAVSGLALSAALQSYAMGRAVAAFALGGVAGTGPRQVALAVPLLLVGFPALWLWGRPLDLLLSGEDEAASLGVDVRSVRRWTIVWVGVVTGAAVALAGNVSFVGLVVPHALRPVVGHHHRPLIVASALLGGVFLAACDLASRLAPATTEVPLGVITGLVGAPTFLWMLHRGAHRHG